MMHAVLPLALLGAGVVASLMLALWAIHLRIANAGIVDIGWAYGLGVLALIYGTVGNGPALPRWSITAMAVIWSARLGTHLFQRVVGKPEEGRYQELRRHWPTHTGLKFLLFFEAQALLDVLLSIPFLLVCANTTDTYKGLSLLQIVGVALWAIAIAGESLADAQLATFKRTAKHHEVCRAGLWNYSRHPNYFFEWLVWVGWAMFALPVPFGWLAWTSPLLMLFFLLRVTGIPATEQQSLRSKGEAYAEYQRTTSAFIPWFRKTELEGRGTN
jgi:steroid 5-alpha reductase family enzyme